MKKMNIVYLQSGGPTSVINASLYGLIKAAKNDDNVGKIYGSLHGVDGLINDDLVDLRQESEENLSLLLQSPGAALGSTRRKIGAERDEIFAKIKKTLESHELNVVFVNGGNDSMDTACQLAEYFSGSGIQVLGIPKTVDNDLPATDHSLGFASAAKAIIKDVKAVSMDVEAYPKGKVTLIEVMGRDAGWLPAAAALVEERYAPDYIYIPEMGFDVDVFLEQIRKTYAEKNRVLVVLPESIEINRSALPSQSDAFGHAYNEGAVHLIAALIKEKLNLPTRGIGLSLLVRSDPFSISQVDQNEAIEMSKFMLDAAKKGFTGKIGCIKRISNDPYKTEFVLEDASEVANGVRYFPAKWILGPGKIDQKAMEDYLSPLIQGDVSIVIENGQPAAANLSLIKAKK